MERDQELTAAYKLVLDHLTDENAHTIAALVDNFYNGGYDSDLMYKAYKAAQLIISGTQ